MVAANYSPLITSVDLSGKKALLGQTDNMFSPVSIDTYVCDLSAVSATVLAPINGYAALTDDGVSAYRSSSAAQNAISTNNFLGFFGTKSLNEGDVGTNPYTTTLSDSGSPKMTVPVIRQGSVWVATSSAISTAPNTKTYILASVLAGGSAANVGTIFQGSQPTQYVYIDITNLITIKTTAGAAGTSVLVEITQS